MKSGQHNDMCRVDQRNHGIPFLGEMSGDRLENARVWRFPSHCDQMQIKELFIEHLTSSHMTVTDHSMKDLQGWASHVLTCVPCENGTCQQHVKERKKKPAGQPVQAIQNTKVYSGKGDFRGNIVVIEYTFRIVTL